MGTWQELCHPAHGSGGHGDGGGEQTPLVLPPTLPGAQRQSLVLMRVMVYKCLKSAISLNLLPVITGKLGGKPGHHLPKEQSIWVVRGH